MVKRTVTGVVMAGFLFLILWLVGLKGEYTLFIFDALVLLMGGIGTYEIFKAVKGSTNEVAEGRTGYRLSATSLFVVCAITFPLTYFLRYMGLFLSLVISFLVAFVFYIFDEKKTFSDFAANVFALFYPMGLLGIVFILDRQYGMIPVLLGLGISLVSDAMAYWIGVLFGKKKIFPKISPKKTYAGCIGGIFGGAIGGVVVYLIFELAGYPTYVLFTFSAISPVPYLWYALIGAVLAFFSEIGDLAASRVKRSVGIKDYGKILGSHGGVLDRIDSILFTVACMAIIMAVIDLCV